MDGSCIWGSGAGAKGCVALLVLLTAGACATNTGQLASWERIRELQCDQGTVVVKDTVVVTGTDGRRWSLERKRTQCAQTVTP